MGKKYSKQINEVLAVLQNEVRGNTHSALLKLTDDYSMTWVYKKRDGSLFPSTQKNIESELNEAYVIRGREYEIKNIAEGEAVVMIELIESYPDPETGMIYRTPLVLVLEMTGEKIRTGRHYCDPNLSYENLSETEINSAYKNSQTTSFKITK